MCGLGVLSMTVVDGLWKTAGRSSSFSIERESQRHSRFLRVGLPLSAALPLK